MNDTAPSADDFGTPISRRGDRQEMSNLSRLPPIAAAIHPETKQVIVIMRGEKGFSVVINPAPPEELNKGFGVNKAQAAAMLAGLLEGWNSPNANPEAHEGKE